MDTYEHIIGFGASFFDVGTLIYKVKDEWTGQKQGGSAAPHVGETRIPAANF